MSQSFRLACPTFSLNAESLHFGLFLQFPQQLAQLALLLLQQLHFQRLLANFIRFVIFELLQAGELLFESDELFGLLEVFDDLRYLGIHLCLQYLQDPFGLPVHSKVEFGHIFELGKSVVGIGSDSLLLQGCSEVLWPFEVGRDLPNRFHLLLALLFDFPSTAVDDILNVPSNVFGSDLRSFGLSFPS